MRTKKVQKTDLASSLRLSLYTEGARVWKGSDEELICSASAKRLFLSRVAHSWSHSSLSENAKTWNYLYVLEIWEELRISL